MSFLVTRARPFYTPPTYFQGTRPTSSNPKGQRKFISMERLRSFEIELQRAHILDCRCNSPANCKICPFRLLFLFLFSAPRPLISPIYTTFSLRIIVSHPSSEQHLREHVTRTRSANNVDLISHSRARSMAGSGLGRSSALLY